MHANLVGNFIPWRKTMFIFWKKSTIHLPRLFNENSIEFTFLKETWRENYFILWPKSPVYRSTYCVIEPTGIGGEFYPYQVDELFARRLDHLNAIQARMCSVSILLQNPPQRNMKRKFLTWFLTLPKSSVKVDSSETWTLSKRGCAVFRFYYRTILRETWRENFGCEFLRCKIQTVNFLT